MTRTAKQIKLAVLATISLVNSAATVAFYMTFAYLHDTGTAPDVQFCMLVATGAATVAAIVPLIIASER